MSSLSDFFGGGGSAPITTLNANLTQLYNDNQGTVNFTPSTFQVYNGLSLSELTTTESYQEILNVSGSGVFEFLLVSTVNQSAAELDFKIIIDGVTVITHEGQTKPQHQSYVPIGKASWFFQGYFAQNRYMGIGGNLDTDSIPFSSSFVVQVKHGTSALTAQVVYDYFLT